MSVGSVWVILKEFKPTLDKPLSRPDGIENKRQRLVYMLLPSRFLGILEYGETGRLHVQAIQKIPEGTGDERGKLESSILQGIQVSCTQSKLRLLERIEVLKLSTLALLQVNVKKLFELLFFTL